MPIDSLDQRNCEPCHAGTPALTDDEAKALIQAVPQWTLSADARAIEREFGFRDFHQTMAFVNALAWIAHREDHHPDLEIGYRRCRVEYSTHAIDGLSENDFICAAKINALLT
jgi:4a-hydroxytetrahydrobiopterin dehydratase